jgi:hypothetical protein
MNDSEKIALISKMIGDFWEFHDESKYATGAETFVTAIYSVIDFEPPKGESQ